LIISAIRNFSDFLKSILIETECLSDKKLTKIRNGGKGTKADEKMASKAKRVLHAPLAAAERVLWEKYNKPNRNLFQALSAFEENGVGRKVVRSPFLKKRDVRILND
jgi:hypothetical protein